ncbi:hypothetical protein [Bacteroides fragilis]|uniref:hypothetical protein n=1 Tax=Bacteroides fragilis TaxID=817 RepID=UPI001C7093D2|nr:hypothetical protein [Bacteroides fragilis]MBW9279499.1 hypothetical protein [Bacteroides fragilis]
MKEKIWTTEMLLDCIFRSGIKTSWRIKENQSLEHEHAKIVALLKAFDLYVVERQQVLDKHYSIICDEYAFNISDFLRGNFIKYRSKKDAAILLKELVDSKIIKPIQQQQQKKDVCFLVREIFKNLTDSRMGIQQSINSIPRYCTIESLVLSNTLAVLEQQAKIIDSALLKIIGYKKPVPEKVLIMKYDFPVPMPETGLLTSFKTLEEILDAL